MLHFFFAGIGLHRCPPQKEMVIKNSAACVTIITYDYPILNEESQRLP
jgi:hypothetical protein